MVCFLKFKFGKKIYKFFFTAKGVLIPPRANHENRPMRSSVEGLNQEIEKLVLIPGLLHTCRPETSMVWFDSK